MGRYINTGSFWAVKPLLLKEFGVQGLVMSRSFMECGGDTLVPGHWRSKFSPLYELQLQVLICCLCKATPYLLRQERTFELALGYIISFLSFLCVIWRQGLNHYLASVGCMAFYNSGKKDLLKNVKGTHSNVINDLFISYCVKQCYTVISLKCKVTTLYNFYFQKYSKCVYTYKTF